MISLLNDFLNENGYNSYLIDIPANEQKKNEYNIVLNYGSNVQTSNIGNNRVIKNTLVNLYVVGASSCNAQDLSDCINDLMEDLEHFQQKKKGSVYVIATNNIQIAQPIGLVNRDLVGVVSINVMWE